MSYTYTVTDGVETFTWDVQGEIIVSDPALGIATQTITPSGGLSRLPVLAPGVPGAPGNPPAVVVDNEYAPGVTIPAPTVTITTPATSTVPAVWTLTVGHHRGNDGVTNTTLLACTDLVGSPLAGYVPTYVTDTGLAVGGSSNGIAGAVWQPLTVGGIYTATISSTTGSGSPRTLGSIAIPAKARAWRPKCDGFVVVGNAADTQVDLFATLGTTTDDQVAYGRGVLGSVVHPTRIGWSGWGAALGTTGGKYSAGYGVVPAGQATTIFLQAKQLASTTSAWTTPAGGPTAAFSVEVSPV